MLSVRWHEEAADIAMRRKAHTIAPLVLILCLFACTRPLSREEERQLDALRSDLDSVRKEVAAAQSELAQYSGGLVKGLLQARLEILKTSEALIQQRIHAIEARSPVTVQTIATTPDPDRAAQIAQEIQAQEAELRKAEAEAAKYSGGLVKAFAATAVATHAQTLALLRQQYLIAKLGLPMPIISATGPGPEQGALANLPTPPPPAPDPDTNLRNEVLTVRLLKKNFTTQDYQEFIFFDLEYNPSGLDKSARAIKGRLNLTDLFGETKMTLNWTVDKLLKPGTPIIEKGMGFKYNQFLEPHQWVRATELQNMATTFTVNSILYEDGSRRDFE